MVTIVLLWVLAVILIVAGLLGTVLPGLPGAPLLFGGFFVAALAEDFLYVGSRPLVAIGVLALLSYVIDFLAGAFGAKRFGASKRAVVGAALGALVGLVFGTTELKRLYLKTLDWILRAQRCFAKCGFTPCGKMAQGNNCFVLMELTRERWEKNG